MTMQYPKRLIESDLPIASLSRLRGRHTLHADVDVRSPGLWWSRKPQHQCRGIWLALLFPDPQDLSISDTFVDGMRAILRQNGLLSAAGQETRHGLSHDLIAFCSIVSDPGFVESPLLQKCVKELASFLKIEELYCLDPFAGCGSIPVEAKRLGLNVISSEYNPIAALYNRLLCEFPLDYTTQDVEKMKEDITRVLSDFRQAMHNFYPQHPELGQPYGYIRFRYLMCEGPGCGQIVPATSKFELDTRTHTGLDYRNHGELELKLVTLPGGDFPKATMHSGSLVCPVCGYTTPRKSIARQRGRLILEPKIVSVIYRGSKGQLLVPPTDLQKDPDLHVNAILDDSELQRFIPTESWPPTEPRRFSPPLYGYAKFTDCHTRRQIALLSILAKDVSSISGDPGTIASRLCSSTGALILAHAIDRHTSFCRWRNDNGGRNENTFSGKSLGMIWDFFEADPLHEANDIAYKLEELCNTIVSAKRNLVGKATVLETSAQDLPLPDASIDLIYTDPPYYSQVPYSHLSDWFFVWLRKAGIFSDIVSPDGLCPKEREIVVDRPHSASPSTHDGAYFHRELRLAFQQCRRVIKPDGVGVIVFAHQETTAWEKLLEGIIESGFFVTSSWPVDTERGGRLQAQGTASLTSSIHLVVRPRSATDDKSVRSVVGSWRDVLDELPRRIHAWLPRLAEEGIVGADAIFACIGPALEIFSRYARVEKASGEQVSLREYLEQVWAAVAREALSMIFAGAETTGFEADARLTAMWLWTLNTAANGVADTGDADEDDTDEKATSKPVKLSGFVLEHDAARKIAQGLGAHLDKLPSIVEVKGDKARLLPVAERARALFGKEAGETAVRRAPKAKPKQMSLFAALGEVEEATTPGVAAVFKPGGTALDRLHQAMLLFAANRGEAVKHFLVEEGVGRDQRLWRLAQSLSALYPPHTEEKRWVDGVLARKKGLGL